MASRGKQSEGKRAAARAAILCQFASFVQHFRHTRGSIGICVSSGSPVASPRVSACLVHTGCADPWMTSV